MYFKSTAVNVFLFSNGDGTTDFVFTNTVEKPTSDEGVLFRVSVPDVIVGRIYAEIGKQVQKSPEHFGFTKK